MSRIDVNENIDRWLIETSTGYMINFGKHYGEDLLQAIRFDWGYFNWFVHEADCENAALVETIAEYMEIATQQMMK